MPLLVLLLSMIISSHRIVSTAPSITEILFALGAGDEVVGDTIYCNYPEAAKSKAKIGGFANPSIELILALKPDLVFMTGFRPDIVKSLEQSRRAEVVTVQPDNVAGIYKSIQTIADKIGLSERGSALVQSLDQQIHENQVQGDPAKRPRVLFVVGRTPGTIGNLVVVGHGAYLSELIDLAGGVNVAGDVTTQYPNFSFEEVIHRDPDIIIDMGNAMSTQAEKQSVKQLWQKYPFLRAVKNNAVFPLSAEYFITPGPRVGLAVRDLRNIFSSWSR